jgi:hypothetical protein
VIAFGVAPFGARNFVEVAAVARFLRFRESRVW